MLQLKNIKKNYQVGEQQIPALKGITVDFRKNEFVCILGPSGCGKTTLMNIIGGLDQYTAGDLVINGKSTKDFKDADWDNYRNKRIGFVFQNYNLITHQTVIANVELALTLSGISADERHEKAKQALIKVGLEDQLYKKPNQLSGGQMQRVAIARALVNSPDILLADEPTGALDTATSKQILDLMKEVTKDKLAIVVTHNPELAEKYATRVVRMLDGVVVEDSNPYDTSKDVFSETIPMKKKETVKTKKKKEKTSMSFLTALQLSLRNLFTKKGRTIMTSIAGSVGIIGIALILAISNGMNMYIDKLQVDTLSSNPITITSTSFDFNQAMNAHRSNVKSELYPSVEKIYVEEVVKMQDLMSKNNITNEYINYINDKISSNWYSDILYKTGLSLNVYTQKPNQTVYSKLSTRPSNNQIGRPISSWDMLLKTDFIASQYDVLKGKLPTNKNEIVIIVDEYNKISEEVLILLGLKTVDDDVKSYTFDEVIGKEYKILTNNQIYEQVGSNFVELSPLDIDYSTAETLKIVGVIRKNVETDRGVMSTGIGYTKELYQYLQSENETSEIVNWMNSNPTKNPFTGLNYEDSLNSTKEEQREKTIRSLGGIKTPNEISIYPVDFDAKTNIKNVLNDYNIGREKDDMVTYTDMSELLGSVMSQVVNIISYVLIGFTSISLLVSCIMIGIITYVSVIERTKEIGILRSIGARK